MNTMAQSRAWTGLPVLSFGFRPFFLAGALQAAISVALWVPWYLGMIEVPTALSPVAWHVHELLFGYLAAVIAGFLLTAVPNWTGRMPVAGWPLLGLFLLWLAGRVAVALSEVLGQVPAMVIALAFPLGLLFLVGREVVAAGNRRNLPVVGLVAAFTTGQAAFLLEDLGSGEIVYGPRVAIAAALILVTLIGGRITPSFTTNWLRRAGPGPMPAPFGRLDRAALGLGAVALLGWAVLPAAPSAGSVVGLLLIVASAVHLARQLRWQPAATPGEPLLAALHLGYGFVPLGLAVAGVAAIAGDVALATAGLHLWTTGAFGLMTLAVMTRATLGHTGRELRASPGTVPIFIAVIAAALSRAMAALLPEQMPLLMGVSAISWVGAFLGFAAIYGPMLLAGRVDR